jgi:hypothetical protein
MYPVLTEWAGSFLLNQERIDEKGAERSFSTEF